MAGTILVADDEAGIRDLVRLYLEKEGFRVQTAGNGAEALALAEQDPPALIILDLMMPEMDGWEVGRRLRVEGGHRLRAGGDIPILILTARDEDKRRRALELGAEAVFESGAWLPEKVDAVIETVGAAFDLIKAKL